MCVSLCVLISSHLDSFLVNLEMLQPIIRHTECLGALYFFAKIMQGSVFVPVEVMHFDQSKETEGHQNSIRTLKYSHKQYDEYTNMNISLGLCCDCDVGCSVLHIR
jgi:hypothetical protein